MKEKERTIFICWELPKWQIQLYLSNIEFSFVPSRKKNPKNQKNQKNNPRTYADSGNGFGF